MLYGEQEISFSVRLVGEDSGDGCVVGFRTENSFMEMKTKNLGETV